MKVTITFDCSSELHLDCLCDVLQLLRGKGFTSCQPSALVAIVNEPREPLDPRKCPHRWQSKRDDTTMEWVVYCEFCEWVYSREAVIVRPSSVEPPR